ncbi:MAG: hypothetical protein DRN20_02525 [Thermoplasmata archaeon]|nr:MAG: hypothetical protein DRN20_02525 [Thermoplasmata archaeon]
MVKDGEKGGTLANNEQVVEIYEPVCSVCGAAVDPKGSVCERCGTPYRYVDKAEMERVTTEFQHYFGIGKTKAKSLYRAGYKSIDDLKKAGLEDLESIEGIGEKTAQKIYSTLHRGDEKKSGDEIALEMWLRGEAGDDVLEKWLSGEEVVLDDGAAAEDTEEVGEDVKLLEEWLRGDESALDVWLSGEETTTVGELSKEDLAEIVRKEREIKEREREINELIEENKRLRERLEELIGKVSAEDFDVKSLVDENIELKNRIEVLQKRLEEMEEELEEVKRGSIAVIKYMKGQSGEGMGGEGVEEALEEKDRIIEELKKKLNEAINALPPDVQELKKKELELMEKEEELRKREAEMRKAGEGRSSIKIEELEEKYIKEIEKLHNQIMELQAKIDELEVENRALHEKLERGPMSNEELEEELRRKERELEIKEKSLALREKEIERLKEELRFKEDELKKLKEPLKYKEEELLRREEDLIYREQRLLEEMKKFEAAKAEAGSLEMLDAQRKIEELKAEIAKKEEELRAKEEYLRAKEEELRLRERALIGEEIEAREEERKMELSIKKVKTGTPRLDDLLYGGIPFGSNVALYGPPFVGKETLMNVFIAEGLKKGIPAVIVLTDKTPEEFRDEMMFVLSGFPEYEKMELVYYIDTYSHSIGAVEEDPYTIYISDPTDHKTILKVVDEIGTKLREKHEYYRLIFRSVSTLIAYLDPQTLFKFLQPFTGKRKRDKAVSLYAIEKGMHSETEIQMIGHLMDGFIEFKVEQNKSFLRVRGICDAQSREWIRYTHSKQGLQIGSFALEHIR